MNKTEFLVLFCMVSKIKEAMNFLELIPEPHSTDIIKISEKVGCTERWVWEAKKRLQEEKDETSEKYSILKDLCSDLKYITSVIVKYSKKGLNLQANELRSISEIGKKIIRTEQQIFEFENG